MTDANSTLEEAVTSYLESRGGVVIERLINIMKRTYSDDAAELQSVEAFKEFLNSKEDIFRVAVSVNNVERARLANPRRASQGLIGMTITALEDMKATDQDSACSVDDVFSKVVAAKKASLDEGEALPYDFADKSEFITSAQRFARIRFNTESDTVYINPRAAHPPRKPRSTSKATPPVPINGSSEVSSASPAEQARKDASASPSSRRRRPQGTPQEPKALDLSAEANDATFIASLIYQKLCARGAINIQLGLTVKLLLRLVSIDFKAARPDADPASMHSLRIFKVLLDKITGLKRQRPRMPVQSPRKGSRRPRHAPELIVWMDAEGEVVQCIKDGLPEDLATTLAPPDVVENMEEIEAGVPQQINIQGQDPWNTSVVGPTANEEVLSKFLTSHKEQAIWGFETEHRVGLHGRAAGKISVIILSHMHHTIVWDVHQGGIPECLRAFFADSDIFKGGVRIGPKAIKLRKQFGVSPAKFVELSDIAETLNLITEAEKERISMRIMTNNVLKCPVSRPPGTRDSNWELRPLTKRQYTYAVEDGFVTALLFMHMVAHLHKTDQGSKLNEACVVLEA